MTDDAQQDSSQEQPTKGHPRGLAILFFAEMWERFCFYGMRALLVLYMTKHFLYGDEHAYGVYGSYNSMVYLTPILGGLIADRLLGYRYAIILGGTLMALGEFGLLIQNELFFYASLGFIIVGNGFFKPNISTLVGKLYKEGDPRRDAGFTIFYMGINIGAFVSTIVCGYIGENYGWTYGFALAGVGMLAGLVTFARGRERLEGHGEAPDMDKLKRRSFPLLLACLAAVPVIAFLLQNHDIVGYLLLLTGIVVLGYLFIVAAKSEKVQKHRMWVILVLIFFHMTFWAFFEQAGSSLTLFTDRNVDRMMFGWEFPTTWGQSFNPLFIMILAPVFAAMWPMLDKRKLNPSIPLKFVLGIVGVGAGFAVLVFGAKAMASGGLTPLSLLVICYLLHTMGELCLSPVGLSMVTKLAPAHMTGMVMGAWFLSIAFAHYIAAGIAGLTGGASGGGEEISTTESLGIYSGVFWQITLLAGGAALLLFILSPLIKRWLHGVK